MDEAIRFLNLKVEPNWKSKKYIEINWRDLNPDVEMYWIPRHRCWLDLAKGVIIVEYGFQSRAIDKNNFVELPFDDRYYLLFLNKSYESLNKWLKRQNIPYQGWTAIIENGEWKGN